MNVTALAEVLDSAKCVFFDFDGPLCRLFAAYPATEVAGQLRRELDSRAPGLLRTSPHDPGDPHSLLTAARRELPGDGIVRTVERLLTEAEKKAAETAAPTPYAHDVVTELHLLGRTLAVTSNNAAAAIEVHLETQGLGGYFSPHVHGRRPDASGLKPDPDCLLRALESTGAAPGQCVMIGDSPSDWKAAHLAGVGFIGYARAPHKAHALETAGAPLTVGSMGAILHALRGTTAPH
ncbi:HAD family hydrolase [Streptomyces sp. MAR4 CNX-425]|uniref:HAD family hydrolase n=1 Tax=Streptomyces sp. MAR4 CNX-425 TaxID=3406343 RepID=UPI003B50B62E